MHDVQGCGDVVYTYDSQVYSTMHCISLWYVCVYSQQRYNWKLGAIELTLNTTDGEFMNMSNTTNTSEKPTTHIYTHANMHTHR